MDAFSYLSVLLSIIIGLTITQVLQGYRALLLNRHRVTLFFPPLAWSVFILIAATQSWWSSFGLAAHREWTFATFAIILFQTVLLYMNAGLILPDIPPEQPIDLKAHYHREITPFYTIWLLLLATSLTKGVLVEGHLPQTADVAFHFAFGAMGAISLAVRRDVVHHVLTALAGLILLVYIGLLFANL